jgi:Ca2+-binding RTX toxin-like protein
MAHFTVSDDDQDVVGTDFDDIFTINGDRDTVSGGAGHDILNAHGVNDVLHGDGGSDSLWDAAANLSTSMDGGEGDDELSGHISDTLNGGAGTDSFNFSVNGLGAGVRVDFEHLGEPGSLTFSWGEFTDLETGRFGGTTHDDTLFGSASNAMTLYGDDGDDRLVGSAVARDLLIGGRGSDFIRAGAAGAYMYALDNGGSIEQQLGLEPAVDPRTDYDTLRGGAGADILYAGYSSAVLNGGGGDDDLHFDYLVTASVTVKLSKGHGSNSDGGHYKIGSVEDLFGGALGDQLIGSDADDHLWGQGGDDSLRGGLGGDQLSGGASADTFIYRSVLDSTAADNDVIFDMDASDIIDLHAVDANANKTGNQTFKIVEAFDGHAGQLVLSYDLQSNNTTLAGDTDGDGISDFQIFVFNGQVTSDSLIL